MSNAARASYIAEADAFIASAKKQGEHSLACSGEEQALVYATRSNALATLALCALQKAALV